MSRILDRLLHLRSLRRWRSAAEAAPRAPLSDLRLQRNQARQLRTHLDRLIHTAEGRLALPQIGSSFFPRPHGTDWSWRPELWRGPLAVQGLCPAPAEARLSDEVKLFHDCAAGEVSLRQIRNTREEDLAPFGLRMDVYQFEGSFLSLVVDLPPAALQGLTREHLLRVDSILQTEAPIDVFARLNIRHGPNTEQMVRQLPAERGNLLVEFDLAYSDLNEKRMEKAWLDLIFDAPAMNQVLLRDLTFSRHPRAAI
ncbi:DUF6478 family protein [Leisingera sp.]|uniref:DUF6478 family protein n=1 Tax=Leisingera sp. TaxID=1879318 RepID=UPI003A94AFBB